MAYIENRYIAFPNDQGDGLTLCDGAHYVIRNCVVDFSGNKLGDIDEALGVTWGCSAEISNCVFRGAGKLVLCGSGDEDRKSSEKGKHVVFRDCIFENFSRRGPEVQDGMIVELYNCVIRNWGDPHRFTVRSFGGWAHGEGSSLLACDCVFMQEKMFTRNFLRDFIGHIGQAVNDCGVRALFSNDAWLPGNWRGLVASDGGSVEARNCYRNHNWIYLDNFVQEMDEEKAMKLVARLDDMKERLLAMFGKNFCSSNRE